MESFRKDAVVGESETIRELQFPSSAPPTYFFRARPGRGRLRRQGRNLGPSQNGALFVSVGVGLLRARTVPDHDNNIVDLFNFGGGVMLTLALYGSYFCWAPPSKNCPPTPFCEPGSDRTSGRRLARSLSSKCFSTQVDGSAVPPGTAQATRLIPVPSCY